MRSWPIKLLTCTQNVLECPSHFFSLKIISHASGPISEVTSMKPLLTHPNTRVTGDSLPTMESPWVQSACPGLSLLTCEHPQQRQDLTGLTFWVSCPLPTYLSQSEFHTYITAPPLTANEPNGPRRPTEAMSLVESDTYGTTVVLQPRPTNMMSLIEYLRDVRFC